LSLAVTHIQSERNSSDIRKRYASDVHFLCFIGSVVAVEVYDVNRIQKTVIDNEWEGINKDMIAACLNACRLSFRRRRNPTNVAEHSRSVGDFRLLPLCKRDLRSFGILHSVEWSFIADVLGEP
jgi:hypothetical protein